MEKVIIMNYSDPNENIPDQVITVDATDLQCSNSVLRKISRSVMEEKVDPEPIVMRMLKALYKINHGRGISAIQIGIPLRIIVVNIERTPGKDIIMIDPVLISVTGRMTERSEGCMSLPNYKGFLARRNKIKIKGYNIEGQEFEISSHGYEANVIQHEMDHLDGILYWDKMPVGSKPAPIDYKKPNKDQF